MRQCALKLAAYEKLFILVMNGAAPEGKSLKNCLILDVFLLLRRGGCAFLTQNESLPVKGLSCTFVLQPVHSFACIFIGENHRDASRTRFCSAHGQRGDQAPSGGRPDRSQSRGRGS